MCKQDAPLNRIIAEADKGYPEPGFIGLYWDPDRSEARTEDDVTETDDTLALFLAREIASVSRGMPFEKGLAEAAKAVRQAMDDLEDVASALEAAYRREISTGPLPGMEAHHG